MDMWAFIMGIEHERIHLETLSVLFRETPSHLFQTPQNFAHFHPSAKRNTARAQRPVARKDVPLNRIMAVSATGDDITSNENIKIT